MTENKPGAYGRWPSDITPSIFANMLKISEPTWSGNGSLFWRERSSALTEIKMIGFGNRDILTVSGGLNVGGELLYGGGGYSCSGSSLLVIDKGSHQLHQIDLNNRTSHQITSSLIMAASPRLSPDGKFAIFVHSDGEIDSIYIQDLLGKGPAQSLISGADFYNFPRWHPDSKQIAWVSWDHPHMPWNSSSLWLAEFDHSPASNPELEEPSLIAGGDNISVQQPEFSPDGRYLTYISDQDGWWQIYLYDLETGEHQQLTNAHAEHGLPSWLQDQQSYLFNQDSSRIFFLRNQSGFRTLWSLDLLTKEETRIQFDESYTWLEDISLSPDGERIALVASGADLPARLITSDLEGKTDLIRLSSPVHLPKEAFSIPEPISWTADDGHQVHGLFYLPQTPPGHRGR